MYNIHLHFSMCIAIVCIVDLLSKDLMVERVIERKWEDLIEDGENL
jgi:hypothetical protein